MPDLNRRQQQRNLYLNYNNSLKTFQLAFVSSVPHDRGHKKSR